MFLGPEVFRDSTPCVRSLLKGIGGKGSNGLRRKANQDEVQESYKGERS
jgi:hypothetical protein